MNEGWIKLFPKLKKWKWYKVQNTKDLFIHCLLSANWKDNKVNNIDIPRGSFITSLSKLSEELNIPKQQIRTALNNLKSTHEITYKSTHHYTLITVEKYNDYQFVENKSTHEITYKSTTIEDISSSNNKNNITNLDIRDRGMGKEKEDIYTFVERNFMRTITPLEILKIQEWQKQFSEDMLKYAIELSVMSNAKNFKYVEGIINNWTSSQYKTLEEIKEKNKKKETKPIEGELFDYDWINGDEEE